MRLEIKELYREIERMHYETNVQSIVKTIMYITENSSLTDKEKIEIINDYTKDYFDELDYVSKEEYE